MTGFKPPRAGRYVLAVSGGIDSVVLLDMLSKQPRLELVVAHFDHGIRPDSSQDAQFVADLANQYGLKFVLGEGKLGAEASEDLAREARYAFLRATQKQHKATGIITAHHRDDLLETAIINLIRGTQRRGLSSLSSHRQLLRPLLGVTKKEIVNYAKRHSLKWRDDPSNKDPRYLRNYIRLSLVPALDRRSPGWRDDLLDKIDRSRKINTAINSAISVLADQQLKFGERQITIPRNWLIMLPNAIGLEIIRHCIVRLDNKVEITGPLLKSSLLFVKTARPGKTKPLNTRTKWLIGALEVHLVMNRPANK